MEPDNRLPRDAQSILELAARSMFDLFANASEGMMLVDREARVVWINDQYRRFLPALPDDVIVGGGGARNPVLVAHLRRLLPASTVRAHDELGFPAAAREAAFFALLGYQALHGRPNTVPGCTGAHHPVVMGKLLPGPNYLDLVRRVAALPPTEIRRVEVGP